MTALTRALPRVDRQSPLGQGGFGSVYSIGLERCVKVFHAPLRGEKYRSLLRLGAIDAWARPSDLYVLSTRFAWPLELFGDDTELVGYAMPEAPESTRFDLKAAGSHHRPILQAKYLIDSSYWSGDAVQSPPPLFPLQQRIEAAIDLHQALTVLHENDLVYGDLSANNVCFTLERHPRVFVLDADSITDGRAGGPTAGGTADWDVPVEDRFGQDRARFALLVWRLLAERPTVRPPDGLSAGSSADDTCLLAALTTCYRQGSRDAFATVDAELRAALDPQRRQTLATKAVASRYARVLLRQRPGAINPDLFASGVEQLQRERRCDEAAGIRRHIALERLRRSDAQFLPDVRPDSPRPATPRSTDELHQWIVDARFDEIAAALAAGKLGAVDRDPWLGRAIAHTHLTYEMPRLEHRLVGTHVELSWPWPIESHVNVATIEVGRGEGALRLLIDRAYGASRAMQRIGVAPGSTVRCELRFGTRGDDGIVHSGPQTTVVRVDGPALVVVPALPVQEPSAPLSPVAWVARVDDAPIAVADPRARRRTRRRWVTALVSLLVVLGGVWASNLVLGDRDLTPAFVAQETAAVDLTGPSTATVTWPTPRFSDAVAATRYRVVFRHFVGTSHGDLDSVDLTEPRWDLTAPVGTTRTAFRVLAIDTHGQRDPVVGWTSIEWIDNRTPRTQQPGTLSEN